jgi:hypothetical protein
MNVGLGYQGSRPCTVLISGKYFSTGSERCTFPASTSWSSIVAVNCLVIDPIRYTESGVAETLFSMSARPKLFAHTSCGPETRPTVMLPMPSLANSDATRFSISVKARSKVGDGAARTTCMPGPPQSARSVSSS